MTSKKLLFALAGMALAACLVFSGCGEVGGAEVPAPKIRKPYISEQPESHSYHVGGSFTAPALTVTIYEWNKKEGALSYQWYTFASVDEYFKNGGGDPIGEEETVIDYDDTAIFDPVYDTNPEAFLDPNKGNITFSYTPAITNPQADEQYFYYVVVTNRNNNAGGDKVAEIQSEVAAISFSAAGDPLYPIIVTSPVSAAYSWGAAMNDLKVKAKLPEGSPTGTLGYKWSKIIVEAGEPDFEEFEDEDADRLTVDFKKHKLQLFENYFVVVVTNTAGEKTKTSVSIPAVLNIRPGRTAAVPVITMQPKDGLYFDDEPIAAISAAGESTDSGSITYQWYSNTANSNKNGTAIAGATDEEYTPTVAANTARFFYAVLTNTNNNVTGSKTAAAASVPAKITRGTPVDETVTVANVFLTIADTYQTTNRYNYIRGYGGMDVAWGNFPRTSRDDTELMYDPDRLGYNMLRIMIKADYTDPSETIAMLLNGDRPDYYENVKIVNKYGGYVAASPWTPPKTWKSNNSINGGGILIPRYYDEFADYLRKFAQNMADNGAPIYVISISNEPNYVAGYDGCEWTGAEMREFFLKVGHFMEGVRGWGGGQETPYVLTMNGESANTPNINLEALKDPESKAAIDVLARHIYGERTVSLWNTVPDLLQKGPDTDRNKGRMEVWMTEHNINSSNATGYYNDSTWNYVWKFLNDVDLVIRMNNENAFVWWASKRFYSMVGDGQFGTTDGSPLPRGWALSHYSRFTIGMTRVKIDLTSGTTSRMTDNTLIPHTEQSNSVLNNTTDDMDNTCARATAFISEDGTEISLIMWTPTKPTGRDGYNMGTVKVELPSHDFGGVDGERSFKVKGITAVRSNGDRANQLFQPFNEVKINADRTAIFVPVLGKNIVSIKLTGEWE